MNPTTIPFTKLVALDAINARADSKDGLDELAASIAAKGLIQPLSVRPADGGDRWEIIDGRRRYRALAKLVKAKTLKRDFAVPVLVRNEDDAGALETSLMANTVRLPMHPVDQFEVFARLGAGGASTADIAARFGIAERTVRQQQALGRLAPVVRAAWRKGTIEADAARAFAEHPNPEVQAATFDDLRKQGAWALEPGSIRRRLLPDRMRASDPQLAFVGADAYLEAGGTITTSLFADDEYVDDPALLAVLVKAKTAEKIQGYIARGWGWAALEDDLPDDTYVWDHVEASLGEGDDEAHYAPAERAAAGVILNFDHAGKLWAELGVIKPDDADENADQDEDNPASDAGDDGDPAPDPGPDRAPSGTGQPPEPDPPPGTEQGPAMSQALVLTLSEVQTVAAATALADDPQLALRVLFAALTVSSWNSPAKISTQGMGRPGVGAEAERDFAEQLDRAGGAKDLPALLAPLIAAALDLRCHHASRPRVEVAALIAALDAGAYTSAVHQGFSALDYFKRSTKQVALDAIADMMQAGLLGPNDMPAAGASKAQLYPHAAELATRHQWLPDFLRHPQHQE